MVNSNPGHVLAGGFTGKSIHTAYSWIVVNRLPHHKHSCRRRHCSFSGRYGYLVLSTRVFPPQKGHFIFLTNPSPTPSPPVYAPPLAIAPTPSPTPSPFA